MKIKDCLFAALLLCYFSIASATGKSSKIDSLQWKLDQEAPHWSTKQILPLFEELGTAYLEEKDFQNAIDILERGIRLAASDKLDASLKSLQLRQAKAYFQLEDYDRASSLLNSCLTNSNQLEATSRGEAFHLLSLVYQINGSFDLAYKNAISELLVWEKLRDSLGMAMANNQIGHIHFAQENFQLALPKYENALALLIEIDDEKGLLETYGALASVHKKLNRKDKALHFNRKALAIAERYGYKPGIAEGKANNADLYVELGLYELAADEYSTALKLFTELDNKLGKVEALTGVGNALVQAGESEQALFYLDEADCLAQQLEAKKQLSLAYKYLAQANYKLDRPEYGYEFLNKYTLLKDSLLNEFSWKEMSNIKNKYELTSRENEIALLTAEKNILAKEKKIKGLYWGLLFVFVAFFSGLVFILFSKWKMQRRLLNLLELRGKKIKAQNDKLAQSNLDLEHFASVASHDLREPLRMINSYTKLLNRKYADSFDANAKEFMHFITDASVRMDNMLTDLLDYSRAEKKGERDQWVESAEIVETVMENLKFKIDQKGAEVNFTKSHLPQLYTNRTAMIQLFQNLISNAVKFCDEQNPEIVVDCVKRGPFYRFSIKDNGIGIEQAKQAKIFEMFTRLHTQEEYEGTGIGLATCKKIVDRQGGKIWVESSAGEGSTFFFTVPQDVSSN